MRCIVALLAASVAALGASRASPAEPAPLLGGSGGANSVSSIPALVDADASDAEGASGRSRSLRATTVLEGGRSRPLSPAPTAPAAAASPVADVLDVDFTPIPPATFYSSWILSGEKAYFSVTVPRTTPLYEHIDVNLAPIAGDVDMYITMEPNVVPGPEPGHWQYKSESHSSADYDIIHTSDVFYQDYCSGAQCVLYIMVTPAAWSFYSNNTFLLAATPSSDSLELEDGVGLVDHAMDGTWDYYRFVVPSDPGADAEVLISLSPYAGDPDCFASTTIARPDHSNHDAGKSSRRSTRDVIRYYAHEASWCPNGYPCTFNIGVTAYRSNATYNIMAHLRTNSSIVSLVDGQSLFQYVAQGEDLQFTYAIPSQRNILQVSVSPVYGDPDLYVTLDGKPATPEHSQYVSLSSSGNDVVLARPGDGVYDDYCDRDAPCQARIGVYAFKPSFFAITAVSGNAIIVPEGVSVHGMVGKDELDHFVFQYTGSAYAITFTLTPLSGDVDLYISNDRDGVPNPLPGPGASTWVSRGSRLRSEIIEIFPTDQNACHVGTRCKYYIGVAGDDDSAAAYTILVRTDDSSPTALQPGQPQLQLLNVSRRAFYEVSLAPGDEDRVEVAISPSFGDPDVYASWGNRTLTRTVSDYRSSHGSGDDSISFSRSEAPASVCSDTQVCTLTIMVYAWTDSLFSIVARTSQGGSVLIDGQSVGGSASAGLSTYYSFIVASARAPAIFSLTPLDGDPDLYVAATPHPGPGTEGVRRSEGRGHETVAISQADLTSMCAKPLGAGPTFPCTLFVAVRAASLTSASWRVSASTTPPTLALASPTSGQVDRGNIVFFSFHLPGSLPTGGDPVLVSVSPVTGSAYTYVSAAQADPTAPITFPKLTCRNGDQPPCSQGNSVMSDFKYSSATSLGSQTVAIRDYVPGADYAIGIQGSDSNSAPSEIQFSITVSGPSSERIISSGVPVDGTVGAGKYQYYKVLISQPGVDVSVRLTPYNGDPDLFVSWHPDRSRPNNTWADARALSSSSEENILITAADWGTACTVSGGGAGSIKQCPIYIGVHGYPSAEGGSSFTLVAVVNSSSATTLLDGQPQTGSLKVGQAALYAIPVSLPLGTHASYSVAVSPLSGDPDLYIRKGTAPGRTPGTYDEAATSASGMELINIGPNDSAFCTTCTLYALVYAARETSYQISFASNGVVTELRNGQPQFASASEGEIMYFAIFVPPNSEALTVTATGFSGDPDLYMSVETGPDVRPNSGSHATWQAADFGDDTITVRDPTAYCPSSSALTDGAAARRSVGAGGCNFIIGVESYFASRFSVVASVNERTVTQLIVGSPQQGRVSGTEFRYYFATLPPVSVGSTTTFTISTSTALGAVDLFATDKWDPNARPGAAGFALPNASYFRYATTDPNNRGGRDSIIVVWTQDDHPSSNVIAIGVRSRQASADAHFTIAASPSETITTLRLNAPSGRRMLALGEMQHFQVGIEDLSADITVNLNLFSGSADVAISTRQMMPSCRLAARPGGTFGPVCSATWQVSSSASNSLRIAHDDPCASAYNQTCQASVDFRPGYFYLGVFGVFAGEYTLTLDGTAAAHDVKFSVSRLDTLMLQGTAGLSIFLTSCSAEACTPADQAPNANHHAMSALVVGSSSRTLIVGTGSAAHCTARAGSSCVYFISVTAICGLGTSCPTDFSIVGASQAGSGVSYIDFASVVGDVWQSQPSSVPEGQAALFELFLQPSSGASRVQINLEACGPGLPSLFVCDPLASDTGSGGVCANPFKPSKADHSFAASTATLGSGGRASVVVPSSLASRLYFSVDTAGSRRRALASRDGGGLLTETFSVSASLNDTYYLVPRTGPTGSRSPSMAAVQDSTGVGLTVTWPLPELESNGARIRAKGTTAKVVMRKGGFAGTQGVSTTACGLDLVASRDGTITRVTERDETSLSVGGLAPDSEYAANVILTCDATCLSTSFADAVVTAIYDERQGAWLDASERPAEAEIARSDAMRRGAAHSRALSAPAGSSGRRSLFLAAGGQSATQSIAFPASATATTGAAPPPPAPEEGFPQGAIIALSVTGGLLAMGGIGFFVYRRCRHHAYQSQYVAFRPSGAMDTLPEPASGYTAMFDD
ncbi:hypothetical protein FNF31_00107 [Cafeteria roenbergensis]|uniref:EGF-like domain-containing protein n=1 Tax=Cafeteria roenbergensis TaxID=33653 RepID=A0A5A8DU57_CAFRO|nr:hypothetical protein FNF31_00107 [Cafeteria roenbergensis]